MNFSRAPRKYATTLQQAQSVGAIAVVVVVAAVVAVADHVMCRECLRVCVFVCDNNNKSKTNYSRHIITTFK